MKGKAMLIRKTYKFYAAHRNEELQDKCRNLHGHRYELRCFFRVQRQGSISTLFTDFDRKIEPLLQREYDHAMLINTHDPLYKVLSDYAEKSADPHRLKRLEVPTSVENLAYQLFTEITSLGFDLDSLELQETDTSTLIYDRQDWLADQIDRDQSERSLDAPSAAWVVRLQATEPTFHHPSITGSPSP